MVMTLIGIMCVVLLLNSQWAGAIAVALSAALLSWLNAPGSDTASQTGSAPIGADGHRLMAAKVVPAWSHQLDAVQATLQDGSTELLTSFSTMLSLCDELQTSVMALPTTTPGISEVQNLSVQLQGQCEKTLHGLQFGDRISQIVDILNQDTQRYTSQVPLMAQHTADDAQLWLDAFAARFTTDEQRLHHQGQPPPPRQDKIDFF